MQRESGDGQVGRFAGEGGCKVTSPLEEAKSRLTIPEVWQRLSLPGNPKASCKSPFRQDRKPSFGVFNQGRNFKDHATGEGGDVVDFVAIALNLDKSDAAKWVCHEAGTLDGDKPVVTHKPAPILPPLTLEPEKPIAFPPDIHVGSEAEIAALARLRGLMPQAVQIASDRGLVFFATGHDSQGPVKIWILTDATRRNAQARRMDGKPWQSIGAKAKTLSGSRAGWPVGLSDADKPERRAVFLVEGGPDLLAAFDLILCAGLPLDKITVCAMLGAGQNLPEEAAEIMSGKAVWMFPHADEAGERSVEAWSTPIRTKGRKVGVFRVGGLNLQDQDGKPIKDLNDACLSPDLDGNPWILRTSETICQFFNLATFAK